MSATNQRQDSPAATGTTPKRSEDVILGGELVLARSRAGAYVIHTFRDRATRRLGSFTTAAQAWEAIDELDADG